MKKYLSALLPLPFSFIYFYKNQEQYDGLGAFIHGFISFCATALYIGLILGI